jgi:CubicO group peptidase (beta-lactamase class C family)
MTAVALDDGAVREAMTYYDSWLAFRRNYLRVPGVQAAVFAGDRVVLDSAYGQADVERGIEMTTRHLFRIASHSKTFTATAVLRLVESGVLRLDDTVGAWVPYLEDAGSPLARITIRELLNHTGGVFRDGPDGDFWQLYRGFPDGDTLRETLLTDEASVLPRNDRFKYSNMGYTLLGLVIEAGTGRGYAEQLRTDVLDRLGLRDTGPELDPARVGEYAVGYSALAYAEKRVPIDHVDTRAMAAATGFFATASDLVTYFSAHFLGSDLLLTDDSKRLMQHGSWSVDSGEDRYGLGLSVTTIGERTLIGHGGGFPGHITSSVADTTGRLAISVLTNAIDGPARELAHAGVRLVDLAHTTKAVTRPRDDLGRFTGRFASLWGVVDVALLGRRLFLISPTAEDPAEDVAELEVVDDRTVKVASGPGYGSFGEPFRYRFGPDGSVESIRGESATTLTPLRTFVLPATVTVPGLVDRARRDQR